jgi:four helix bundle protein
MPEKINSFRDLLIWQKGMEIVKVVYKISQKLPKEELFALTSQIRRSAVSIPSNIAEGRSRSTRKDFAQFLHIALGSLAELETQLYLIEDIYSVKYRDTDIFSLINEEQKMVSGMLNKLKANT